MDINKYLNRINYKNQPSVNVQTLFELHENHVFNVPFENLDIYSKILFDLDINNIYKKIIDYKRGGFCYELNFLFCWLLFNLGFKSRIISARIYDELGRPGPEYDHMCIFIEIDHKKYLADVGFGDLFLKPLEIKDGIQSDGRNQFKTEKINEVDHVLLMAYGEFDFQKKYLFNLNEVKINDFEGLCYHKQTNPLSYFVQNTICTKPTKSGRLTLFNNKLTKKGSDKFELIIYDDEQLRIALWTFFNITF
jgi:N-hydroxyarylamine O-acetyltransferase